MTTEEKAPYIKTHNDQNICFADTITQACNALKRTDLNNTEDGEKLVDGHLMLFGVEDWKNAKSLTGAFKAPTNTFKRLEVFGCDMDDRAQKIFAESLDNLDNLERFDLDNTKLTPAGASSIFTKVGEAINLKVLNLQGSVNDEVLANINDVLVAEASIFKSLHEVDLKINDLSDKAGQTLGLLMSKLNPSEKVTFDLFYNNLGPTGITQMVPGLEGECCITHLDLSCNNIGDGGATSLGRSLRINHSIKELKLALNNIGNNGALEIFSALAPLRDAPNQARNSTLEKLDISANVMKDGKKTEAAMGETLLDKLKDIDDRLIEIEESPVITDDLDAERRKLQQKRGELDPAQPTVLLDYIHRVIMDNETLLEFDITGIEFDHFYWELMAQTLIDKQVASGPKMTVRFSIVDLMDEKNLKTMEDVIWGANKEKYNWVDWRRKDDAPANA